MFIRGLAARMKHGDVFLSYWLFVFLTKEQEGRRLFESEKQSTFVGFWKYRVVVKWETA